MSDDEEPGCSEIILCPSCKEFCHIPMFLPCSHNLCKNCILQTMKLMTTASPQSFTGHICFKARDCAITCPTCGVDVELPSPDWESLLDYLPVNWVLKDLVDRHIQQRECKDHGSNWKLFFCEKTQRFVCRACRPTLLEEDSVVTLEDAWSTKKDFVLKRLKNIKETISSLEDSICSHLEIGVQNAVKVAKLCLEEFPTKFEGHGYLGAGVQARPLQTDEEPFEDDDMEMSLKGLTFLLDPFTAHPYLKISPPSLTVTHEESVPVALDLTYHGNSPSVMTSPAGAVIPLVVNGENDSPSISVVEGDEHFYNHPMVLGDVAIGKGLYYWEVDVQNSRFYRIGVCNTDIPCSWGLGETPQSWCLEQCGTDFSILYDGRIEKLGNTPLNMKKIGVLLNRTGGTLSFYNVTEQGLFCTIPSCFPKPVCPAFTLAQGKLTIFCGFTVPDYVFTFKASIYRWNGQTGSSWYQDDSSSLIPLIQKFEGTCLTDSDSGLMSTYGSSSTLNSWSGALSTEHFYMK
nr:PREDICTED: E3 ubiquitin-protein ligase TRIM69-like [Latimeria chalumnae]|eukprot:XP_005996831.1 PREDICTED: E3 ubiquitin-protein ligase TRIM69-like [Latimeria chalumnae]